MRWKGSAATSKLDHGVVVGHVLRPRMVLRVLAGAGNDGEGVAASGGLGMHGASEGGQQGRGTGPGKGEYDAWRSIQ
jgi:hypothetical protein